MRGFIFCSLVILLTGCSKDDCAWLQSMEGEIANLSDEKKQAVYFAGLELGALTLQQWQNLSQDEKKAKGCTFMRSKIEPLF